MTDSQQPDTGFDAWWRTEDKPFLQELLGCHIRKTNARAGYCILMHSKDVWNAAHAQGEAAAAVKLNAALDEVERLQGTVETYWNPESDIDPIVLELLKKRREMKAGG